MLYRRRVIPPKLEEVWGLTPRLAEALARKESSDCSCCGAKLRIRRLAEVMLELYPAGNPPAPARSIREWVDRPQSRALRIAEINLIDGLHAELSRLPGHAYSEFLERAPGGAVLDGVRREDLTRLTYADASFDIVLTSETLEHVAGLNAALGEIRRVLKPGGRHVFTIPLLPGVVRTFARAVIEDGRLVQRAPAIAHPGGDVGYPVFTEFGADFPDLLRAAGFELEVRFGPVREDDLAQVYVCRRPAT
jgi:SAM-dependent methyltransferase